MTWISTPPCGSTASTSPPPSWPPGRCPDSRPCSSPIVPSPESCCRRPTRSRPSRGFTCETCPTWSGCTRRSMRAPSCIARCVRRSKRAGSCRRATAAGAATSGQTSRSPRETPGPWRTRRWPPSTQICRDRSCTGRSSTHPFPCGLRSCGAAMVRHPWSTHWCGSLAAWRHPTGRAARSVRNNQRLASASPAQRAGPRGEPRKIRCPRPTRRLRATGRPSTRAMISPSLSLWRPRGTTRLKSRIFALEGQRYSTYGTPRAPRLGHNRTGASMWTPSRSRSTARWARKSRAVAKPAPDSSNTVAPVRRRLKIARTAGGGMSNAAGTINGVQRDVPSAPRAASADSYPATGSRRPHCVLRSRRTRRGRASTGRPRSSDSPAVREPATQPRNPLRVIPISQPSGDEAVHGLGGVVELLVGRVAVTRLHFGHQPAVVPDLGQRGTDGGPVVVAQKQIGVHALVAAAPALFHHVLHVNPSDPRPVDLDPLLRKPGVVDVPDVEVDPHRGIVDVVEKLPELARAHEKPVLGVAVLAPDLDACPCGRLAQRPEGVHRALVHLVVGDLRGHEARDHEDRVGAEQYRGLDLPLHDARRPSPDRGVARGEGRGPVQPGRDVGYDEAGVLDLPPELPHFTIRSARLKPGDVAQPELDAVEPGLFDELQAFVESPLLRNHVVADS